MLFAAVTTIHVKIFFYGLIAFSHQTDGTNVLLEKDRYHTASLISDAVACDGCSRENPEEEIFKGEAVKNIWRAPIESAEVEIKGITKMVSGSVLHGRSSATFHPGPISMPRDQSQGADSSWVPDMSEILWPDVIKIKPSCIGPNPSDCQDLLIGRLGFSGSALRTCRLVEAEPSCHNGHDGRVYAFSVGKARQALSEIMVAEFDVTGTKLEVYLKGFSGVNIPLVFTPNQCGDGAWCINIAIRNVAERVSSPQRCQMMTTAPHFAHFFDFIYSGATSRPIPRLEGATFLSSVLVQPSFCNALFLPDRARNEKLARRDREFIDIVIASAQSRPICPMVEF